MMMIIAGPAQRVYYTRLVAAGVDEDGVGFGDDSGCGVSGRDEPICISVDYPVYGGLCEAV
jgi:hypothetical protein